jgi:hypothetical protein
MAASKIDRRQFIETSAKTGVTLCGLCTCFAGVAAAGEKIVIDPQKLNYCGYICPTDCKFLKGTLDKNEEMKQIAWAMWKIEERYGIPYKRKQAFCYGCKTGDKPAGVVLSHCEVRACAIEKNLDCCIECAELETCDKDLWRRFPTFRQQIFEIQKDYRKQA